MYETFEHTADVGIRARAGSLDELFAEAAKGLFSVMLANPEAVRAVEEVTFALAATTSKNSSTTGWPSCSTRFAPGGWCWRSSRCGSEGRESSRAWAASLSHPTRLTATARGEPIDLRRHEIDVEVKAITWCGLKVERTADGWMAEVIVDI